MEVIEVNVSMKAKVVRKVMEARLPTVMISYAADSLELIAFPT